MSWFFKASRFTSIKGSPKFYQRLHIKLENANQRSLAMVWLDVTQLIKRHSVQKAPFKYLWLKPAQEEGGLQIQNMLQHVQDGHLKLSSTSLDQEDLKSVFREINVKLLIALLQDKGMMEFLPALLCLITMDLKTWALTNGWWWSSGHCHLSSCSRQADNDFVYSGWDLVDLKGNVARYEVVLTKLLKLPAWNFNG